MPILNSALHGMWLWRFVNEKRKLWRRVMETRWDDWERDGGRRGK